MHSYKKLHVYEAALSAAEEIYRFTRNFPREERYSLTDQLRRCAVSIPSNISEGCGRSTARDTAQFLSIAIGSAYEAETQLELAKRLGYGANDKIAERLLSLQRQLIAFRKHVLKQPTLRQAKSV